MASELVTLTNIGNEGGRNPAQETRYQQLKAMNSQGNSQGIENGPIDSGYSGGFSGGSNPIQIAQQLLDFQKQNNAPVVSALQGQVDPLKQRYSDLIASIKGNQTTATNNQTLTTSNELGKRGILPTSGLYQQELTNAVNPILSDYTDKLNSANTGESADLADLATKIATAQAGSPTDATSAAMNFLKLQQDQSQNSEANRLAEADLANKTAQTQYDINKPYYAPTTGNSDASILQSIFGITPTTTANTSAKTTAPAAPSYFTPTKPVNITIGKTPGLTF